MALNTIGQYIRYLRIQNYNMRGDLHTLGRHVCINLIWNKSVPFKCDQLFYIEPLLLPKCVCFGPNDVIVFPQTGNTDCLVVPYLESSPATRRFWGFLFWKHWWFLFSQSGKVDTYRVPQSWNIDPVQALRLSPGGVGLTLEQSSHNVPIIHHHQRYLASRPGEECTIVHVVFS